MTATEEAAGMGLYPNPVERGTAATVNVSQPGTLRLNDALGRAVLTRPVLTSGAVQLPTHSLAARTYLVEAVDGRGATLGRSRLVVEWTHPS